jgi:hypothetical protein
MPGRLTRFPFRRCFVRPEIQRPQPEKPDLPYLLHADNLVATEAGEAKQETRKDEILYVIDGATSPVSTPLASPIFLMRAEQLVPEKLEIYKMESKNGRREVLFQRKKKQTARPIHRNVTKLADNLYRIDVGRVWKTGVLDYAERIQPGILLPSVLNPHCGDYFRPLAARGSARRKSSPAPWRQ